MIKLKDIHSISNIAQISITNKCIEIINVVTKDYIDI